MIKSGLSFLWFGLRDWLGLIGVEWERIMNSGVGFRCVDWLHLNDFILVVLGQVEGILELRLFVI